MTQAPLLHSVMTPFPYTIDSMDTIATARALMDQHAIGHLPVMHGGKLAGMLSRRDVQVVQGVMGVLEGPGQVPVWAVCSREPRIADLNESLGQVAATMANEQIGSILVTKEGKLAGILTTTDVCRFLAKTLNEDLDDECA